MKETYIIGVCCSAYDGVSFFRARGTRDQIKQYMYELIKEDRNEDPDSWDFGTESPDEVAKSGNGFYAFGSYSDYHIDYTARPESEVGVVELTDPEPKDASKMIRRPLKAVDIEWDVDLDEAYELLDSMDDTKAAEIFMINPVVYARMSEEDRHDHAYYCFHHHSVDIAEFVGLPNEVVVPDCLDNDEDISDWLSDEYGYCHRGFDLVEPAAKEA